MRLKNINSGISARDYREWYEYSIIDNGIVDDWVYMSNPYFVKSIARGETHEASIEKSVSISPKASIDIPSGSQSSVNKALAGEFSLGFTGTYSTRITITLEGPDSPYNTRTFYYTKGYHKHNITVVEEYRSNWDGLIREFEYEDCFGYEPAVRSYSEDERI